MILAFLNQKGSGMNKKVSFGYKPSVVPAELPRPMNG